jgi:acetylornithine/N-succinyldiaminopimelate aminotransferase
MVGLELNVPVDPIISECADAGLLMITAGERVLRFVPPLVITQDQIKQAISILTNVLLRK